MTALQTPAPVSARTLGDVAATRSPTASPAARYVFAGLRIALGFIFLWAFLDKVFGLGHETTTKAAWINGGNPTKGFLSGGAKGPFADFYHSIAGAGFVNWLFMLALLGIGVALIAGIGMRLAAVSGALLMVMMWTVVLPPANNLFLDDHLIYAGLLAALALVNAGDTFGLGRIWSRTTLVREVPILR